MEEVFEWRRIWKNSIETCQNAIKQNDQAGKLFKRLRLTEVSNGYFPYKDDRMVDFEEGISYECLKQYDKAIAIYEKVSNPEGGLPVNHWRKRAYIFLQRALKMKAGCPRPSNIVEGLLPEVQWNAFYYLHSFAYIPDNVSYMAISSMSRIDSEPEMAIAIFRLCVEEIIRYIFPSEYHHFVEYKRSDFSVLMEALYGKKPLLDDENDFSSKDKESLFKDIIHRGNVAIHGNDHGKIIDYDKRYREDTINGFMQIMQLANTVIANMEKHK